MHELLHFYTWYRFGDRLKEIGAQRYNDIKESFTFLLNIEFIDLMGGVSDEGYAQHKEMRGKVVDVWNKTKDINEVWKVAEKMSAVSFPNETIDRSAISHGLSRTL